ncbi:carboxypeptidase regulatory-like domain-containing protein [Mucilaginibacter sp. UR6-1]|uniref:carboxypeptidase-like regulatory domain-containing protein n=1 Tax=Mucilaginibacter sp. UR6-1 TaxID=1435643 RepID=UPI001E4CA492|nr:carboxypeptidase-like regulatory domain-containing protein [Mucilaginibacter sp. UR6-1]MCC8407924.1 carboxypeptidase regulatory-like domain-containing protein [Mucilaginibacter sp. UR6-1]
MKIKNIHTRFILILIALLGFTANVRGQVNVSVQLLPPVPNKITDYSSRPQLVVINIINTSRTVQRIQLRGAVTGDNGIELRTKPSYKSKTAMILNPGEVRNLNGNDLAYFFDYTQLNYTGINQTDFIKKNGLPEGTYQFCLRAYDYDTNQPLSADEPLGCSAPFIINNLEPPVIIKPYADENLSANVGQTFVISWSTPAGSPPTIKYRIRMVEILGNSNPNDALMTATQPYFFDKEVMGNMYVYNPADPQLTPGRRYAMMIEGFDPLGQRAFRNNGRSEVILFSYGLQSTENLANIPVLVPVNGKQTQGTDVKNKPNLIEVNSSRDLYIRWDSVPGIRPAVTSFTMLVSKGGQTIIKKQMQDGTMYYQAAKADVPLQNGQRYIVKIEGYERATNKLIGVSDEVPFTYKIIADDAEPLKDTLNLDARIAYKYDGESTTYPYKGTVYLYKSYRLRDTVGSKISDHTLPAAEVYGSEDELAATGTADADGKVHFNFASFKTPAKLPASIAQNYPGNGNLSAVYQVRLANPYLADPDQSITFGTKQKDAGDMVATAYAYDLKVNINKGYTDGSSLNGKKIVVVNEGLAGLKAVLYRKQKAANIPKYEADKLVQEGLKKPVLGEDAKILVVATDTTRIVYDKQGKAHAEANFKNLLCANSPDDTYWIGIYSGTNKVIDEPFRYERPKGGVTRLKPGPTSYLKINKFRYNVTTDVNWVTADPPLANLKGRILYRYKDGVGGARPLDNKSIRLVPVYVLSDTISRKQYIVSDKTNLIPVNSNNTQIQGEPEKTFKDLPNFIGDVNGTAGQTKADGSFEMTNIPLWDSVKNFTGLYNLPVPVIKKPEAPKAKGDKNIIEEIMTEIIDSKINPADNYVKDNSMNPSMPYDNKATNAFGGGVINVNSSNVFIGGEKGTFVNNQVNGLGAQKGALQGKMNQMGGPHPAFDDNPYEGQYVSPNPMKLIRCYRVIVNEKDYLSPENNIIINPLETVDAGTLYSDVKTFIARVVVRAKDDHKVLTSVGLLLKRRGSENDVIPKGESEQVPARIYTDRGKSGGYNYVLADRLFTQADSNRNVFKHLLAERAYDMYPSINDTANNLSSYKDGYPRLVSSSSTGTFNNDYVEPIVDYSVELEPDEPIIAGRLLNANGTNGITEGGIWIATDKGMQISVPLLPGGYFVYQAPKGTNISKWKLSCAAWGYEPNKVENPPVSSTVNINGFTFTMTTVNNDDKNFSITNGWVNINLPDMKPGQKIFKNFYFIPKATITGTVVNAKSIGIPALYKVEGSGLIEETTSNCTTPSGGGSASGNNSTTVFNGQTVVNLPGQVNIGNQAGSNKNFNPVGNANLNAGTNNKNVGTTSGISNSAAKNIDNKVVVTPSGSVFTGTMTGMCIQKFSAAVPTGKQAKLIIIPNDLKYFNDTVTINSPALGENKIGARTLITREHRMNFIVRGRRKDGQIVPLSGTKIKLLDSTLIAGGGSNVTYQFANISQQNFWVKITPPANTNFIPQEQTIYNVETKNFQNVYITLDEGDAVYGTVTLAGAPLPNAEVSVTQGSGSASAIAITGADGKYRINGVKNPIKGKVNVTVSAPNKSSQQFIVGQTRQATINAETNFDLTNYNDLDISHLLGYTIKVTGLQKSNGKTYLSGEIVLPDDAEFRNWDNANKITFSNVAIKANTAQKRNSASVLYAEPEADVELENVTLKSRFNEYNVMIKGESKAANVRFGATSNNITIKKLAAFKGAINGKVHIVDNSFNFPQSYMSFTNSQFYFADRQNDSYTNSLQINTTTGTETGGQAPVQASHVWYFSNSTGKALSFKYLGFKATSELADSYFTNSKINIKPTITANVETPDDKPLEVKMPKVTFNTTTVDAVTSAQPIEFNLENWKVKISKWVAATEEGGILATAASQNYVQTTAGLNISFKTFRLRSDEMLIDDVNLSQLKLGGIKDVQVNPGNVVFGLDERTGNDLKKHFVLRLLGQYGGIAGSIKDLPGFTKPLDLEAVTLVSNGEQYIDFATNSSSVKVYNAVNFKPIALEATEGGFKLAGDMDFGIPRLEPQYGGFTYTAGTGGQLKWDLDLKEIKFDIGKGYVTFTSLTDPTKDNGKKILSEKHIELWGTVTEPGKLDNLEVKLTKDVDASGNATIAINQRAAVYPMAMGGSGNNKMIMNVSKTWTKVINNDWDYLRFTGKMDNQYQGGGFGDKDMTFAVYGEIQLDDGKVQLSNIKTPFGKMELVFDWPKKEIRGTVQIEGPGGEPISIPGGLKFKGMAETLLGTQGFYFVLAGDVNVPTVPLIFPFKAGILIAYHNSIPKAVFDKTSQFMYNKTYPCGTGDGKAFKGFMVAARKDVIDPVNFKLDVPPGFPIASAFINIEVGVDATFYGSFTKNIELSFTPAVFGEISMGLGSGLTCTEMSAKVKLNAMGRFSATMVNADPLGDYVFIGALCMSLHLDGYIRQRTPVLVDCISPTLVDFNKGFTLGAMFGLRAGVNAGGVLAGATNISPSQVLGNVKIEPFFKVLMSDCNENMSSLCVK